jgi:8-oxo-dGTP pyrophosphatase MutT (NUDIX family)
MNKPRRVAARGIIFRNNELLVTKFKQENGSESDYWGTFGGGVDSEESLHDAIHREMIEETGIAPVIGRLLFIQQFMDEELEHLEFFFHIENTEDYEIIDFEKTSHGALELTRSAFVDPKANVLLPAFLGEIDIKDYVENNRPVYFYTRPRS